MNKKIILIFLIIGILFVYGCGNKDARASAKVEVVNSENNEGTTNEVKEFTMTAKQWEFNPSTITVNKGDRVKLNIKSLDVNHGFAISDFNVNSRLEPGKETVVEFVADKTGTFTFFCSVQCGEGHGGMKGKLIVN